MLIADGERRLLYHLPDNGLTTDVDSRRILWGAEDMIRNRPALSRWHPDYADAFAAFLAAPSVFRQE
ncbi:MAG: hypothetical protein JO267_02095 [Alphaproteobacteria bacterium]|nr:hypothetical protein [Alphaproteobacteria bacterium]